MDAMIRLVVSKVQISPRKTVDWVTVNHGEPIEEAANYFSRTSGGDYKVIGSRFLTKEEIASHSAGHAIFY